jgi:hypothetical protein
MVRQDEAMAEAGTTFLPAGAEPAPSWRRGLESAGAVRIRVAAKTCTQTSLGPNLANERRSKSNRRLPSKKSLHVLRAKDAFAGYGIAKIAAFAVDAAICDPDIAMFFIQLNGT